MKKILYFIRNIFDLNESNKERKDNLISTTIENEKILDEQICPFCKKSDLKIINEMHGIQIKCNYCKSKTGVYPDINTLIDIWNTFCGGTIKRK